MKKIEISNGKISVLLANWDDLTDEEKSIYQSQIYQRNFQKSLKTQIDGFLKDLNSKQYATMTEYMEDCYKNGYLGAMYSIHKQGIPIISPIDQKKVTKAMFTDSKISKKLYTKLGEDVEVLKKRIANNLSRGIATASDYKVIARNIAADSNVGFNRAMRITRTEGNRISNESAYDASMSAKDKGADVVKSWDAALDKRTRDSHRQVDGEIRELDEKFSNGLKYPGDSAGGAAEVVNCRCALLQRAKWALDDDELETLKERAAYYGLDKTENFQDFKKKYLKAAELEVVAIDVKGTKPIEIEVEAPKPKKEYLTEKKLKQYIDDADVKMQQLEDAFKTETGGWGYKDAEKAISEFEKAGLPEIAKTLKNLKQQMDDLDIAKKEWQTKLDAKLTAKEIKKLKKEQIALQEQLDKFEIKTYSGIWKDDVTTLDWKAKSSAVQAKKDYFEKKFLQSSTDIAEMQKWKDMIDKVDDFDKQGAAYYKIHDEAKSIDKKLDKLRKNGIISGKIDDAFTQERKDAAYWFTDKNGGVKGADKVLRPVCGDVWKNASKIEKDSIYEYTSSYHKFNEPLRGIEYGTSKFLGVGNVDLEEIGTNYGGYKRGQVKKQIDAMTSIIEKSTYEDDLWVQRGCGYGGMDKFFGIDASDFNLPEDELAAKLLDTTPTEHGFFSTGVSKGKGFSHQPIIMNIYAPSGTKMMYAEPFSAFGNGSGRNWDGIAQQPSFGSEAEMIFQRETTFRITKVEKSGNKIYIDMEVIEQEKF